MKKSLRFTIILLALLTLAILPTVSASAATHEPYGYTYDDSSMYRTVYKFYSYNTTKNSYTLIREFYSKGNYVYYSNGIVITNNAAGSGSRYCGFDEKGNFYIITKQASLLKVDTSNRVSIQKLTDSVKLNYNTDDIAVSVTTKAGNFYLPSLRPAPETDDNEDNEQFPTVSLSQNRIEIYTNSAGEQVYDAYKNGKKVLQLLVSKNEKSVLNATAKVRLTDTLQGAKFVGVDTSYNVYLYEGSSLYRFKFGKWYSAQKMSLSGKYKSYKKDKNGFITKIVTSNSSYTIKQLATAGRWKATQTYAVTKSGYTTLYVKGSTTSHTLSFKSGNLYLDGKKVATNVKKFVFVSSKKFAFIKTNEKAYTATLTAPTKARKIASGVKSFKTSYGLGTRLVTKKGVRKLS